MADRHIYRLDFMAKTPEGVAQEVVVQFTASTSDVIGKHLVDSASKYGTLHNLAFSFIPCPVCGKCVVCGD